jgi:ERCC4-related helicase
MNFSDCFHQATGNSPYDYQRRLAEGRCEARLINIPTGLGKVTTCARASRLAK